MANKRLLVAVLVFTLVTFFAMPFSAFATPGDGIKMKQVPDNVTDITLYFQVETTQGAIETDTIEMDPPGKGSPDWSWEAYDISPYDGYVSYSLLSVVVSSPDGDTEFFYTGDETGDIQKQGSKAPMTYSANGGVWNTGASINFWFQYYPGEDPTYSVYYDANGGTGSQTDDNDYAEGDEVTVLDQGSIAWTGHIFEGWNTEEGGGGISYAADDTFDMPANDVTLYAQWSEIPEDEYVVLYDANGGTGSQTDSNTYPAGATVTVLDQGSMEWTGYTFEGWNTEANGSGTSYAADNTFEMPANDVTLYAQWEAIPEDEYVVLYDANGGTGSQTDNSTYPEGAEVTVLDQGSMEWEGYTFEGWNTEANGSGTSYAADNTFEMPANDVTLYAQWEAIPPVLYPVTYNANGGINAPTDPDSPYEAGVTVEVLDIGNMTYEGHTFIDWVIYYGDVSYHYDPGDTFKMPISNNVVLYAQWEVDEVPTYSVIYNANGGTGSQTDSNDYTEGALVTVLGQGTIAWTGYDFTGWNTQADGDGIGYDPDDTFDMPGNDVTLYAQWSQIPDEDTPGIALSKTVDDPRVSSRNANVEYTFEVKNTGDYNLYEVYVYDEDLDQYFYFDGILEPGETFTTTFAFDLEDLGTGDISDWDGNVFTNNATAYGYGDFQQEGVSDSDDATVTYHRSSGGGGGGTPTTTVEEEPTPAAPAPVIEEVVLDQPIPAAPLPQTGGLDPLFLYGLGALLASGGAAMKRRKK